MNVLGLSSTIIIAGGPGPRFPFPIDRLDPGSFSYRITAMSPGGQVSSSDVSFAIEGAVQCDSQCFLS